MWILHNISIYIYIILRDVLFDSDDALNDILARHDRIVSLMHFVSAVWYFCTVFCGLNLQNARVSLIDVGFGMIIMGFDWGSNGLNKMLIFFLLVLVVIYYMRTGMDDTCVANEYEMCAREEENKTK